MTEQLLTAVFPESIRDEVIDVLIPLEEISGFSLWAVDGYSREHSHYDLREQVTGYRRLCRLEVVHRSEHQAALLQALSDAALASHLRYWISPLLVTGIAGERSDYG